MARKTPNFGGFTLKDIAEANVGLDFSSADKSIAKVGDLTIENSNAINDITQQIKDSPENLINSSADKSIAKVGDLTIENSNAINDITRQIKDSPENLINSSADKSIAKIEEIVVRNDNVINSITITKNVNQALFARVREHLYKLLGDNESVEVKLSEVISDMNINPHSFYKYLQTLRETDFAITKLRYSTKIRRR